MVRPNAIPVDALPVRQPAHPPYPQCIFRNAPAGRSELRDHLCPDRNHSDEQNQRSQRRGLLDKHLQHGITPVSYMNITRTLFSIRSGESTMIFERGSLTCGIVNPHRSEGTSRSERAAHAMDDFLKIFRSIEELLYEVMSWLVF